MIHTAMMVIQHQLFPALNDNNKQAIHVQWQLTKQNHPSPTMTVSSVRSARIKSYKRKQAEVISFIVVVGVFGLSCWVACMYRLIKLKNNKYCAGLCVAPLCLIPCLFVLIQYLRALKHIERDPAETKPAHNGGMPVGCPDYYERVYDPNSGTTSCRLYSPAANQMGGEGCRLVPKSLSDTTSTDKLPPSVFDISNNKSLQFVCDTRNHTPWSASWVKQEACDKLNSSSPTSTWQCTDALGGIRGSVTLGKGSSHTVEEATAKCRETLPAGSYLAQNVG